MINKKVISWLVLPATVLSAGICSAGNEELKESFGRIGSDGCNKVEKSLIKTRIEGTGAAMHLFSALADSNGYVLSLSSEEPRVIADCAKFSNHPATGLTMLVVFTSRALAEESIVKKPSAFKCVVELPYYKIFNLCEPSVGVIFNFFDPLRVYEMKPEQIQVVKKHITILRNKSEDNP